MGHKVLPKQEAQMPLERQTMYLYLLNMVWKIYYKVISHSFINFISMFMRLCTHTHTHTHRARGFQRDLLVKNNGITKMIDKIYDSQKHLESLEEKRKRTVFREMKLYQRFPNPFFPALQGHPRFTRYNTEVAVVSKHFKPVLDLTSQQTIKPFSVRPVV